MPSDAEDTRGQPWSRRHARLLLVLLGLAFTIAHMVITLGICLRFGHAPGITANIVMRIILFPASMLDPMRDYRCCLFGGVAALTPVFWGFGVALLTRWIINQLYQ